LQITGVVWVDVGQYIYSKAGYNETCATVIRASVDSKVLAGFQSMALKGEFGQKKSLQRCQQWSVTTYKWLQWLVTCRNFQPISGTKPCKYFGIYTIVLNFARNLPEANK